MNATKQDRWNYQTVIMGNGLILIRDRACGLQGCYELDGSYRHGDLRLPVAFVLALVSKQGG